MVEWLAGNRIRGTTAERPALGLPSGSVGGWVELARTTLGSGNANITVSSLADKRYYMVLGDYRSSSAINANGRLGNGSADTGSNYAERQSDNGGTDSTLTSQSSAPQFGTLAGNIGFGVEYITNLSGKEKLGISHSVEQNTAGAGNAPNRNEMTWKWVNTSNPLDVVERRTSVNTYNANSEVVVLGWDPADTHTTNFWEELASVELGSAGDLLDSGVFAAKKYLWIQTYAIASGVINQYMRVGTTTVDTGNNYSLRYNSNGGTDGTLTSFGSAVIADSDDTTDRFVNLFGINNSGNEKLFIGHNVNNTVGAANAALRGERVHKWANTSGQITKVEIRNTGAGSFDTGSIMKVWGSD